MADSLKTKKPHAGWNRVVLVILTTTLVLVSFATVLRDNFTTGAKSYLFLKESRAFDNIAQIAKNDISNNLPDNIKNNFIKRAIITKIMDIIITPENVSKVAEPAIIRLYKLSGKATKIADKQIVFDTTVFKSQAKDYLPAVGLPQGLADTTSDFVNSIPNTITILDVENNPNSPLAILVKLQSAFRAISTVTSALWLAVVVSILAALLLNVKNLRRLLKTYYLAFGISAGLVLGLSYGGPAITASLLPATTPTNALVNNLVNNFCLMTQGYGWILLSIAAATLAISWLTKTTKAKQLIATAQQKTAALIKKTFS
ncbi:hypothetical protein EXS53_00380 [Patescibacteria group bacterium]|nr:hypothetical protein [Patescibacteria group bacterium]